MGHVAGRKGKSLLQNQRGEMHPKDLEVFPLLAALWGDGGMWSSLVWKVFSRKQQRGRDLQESYCRRRNGTKRSQLKER